jgi:uncharacterized protein (TIGR02145 family)
MKRNITLTTCLFLFSFFAVSQGTVIDPDGNVYPTVMVGEQEWMGENLRTSRYQNGDLLGIFTSDALWNATTGGAWVNYDNLEENNELYGKLYNWYAVADPRGLCPLGWRMPTDNDLNMLVGFIDADLWGNNNIAGTELKSRRQENSPLGNEFQTNEHPRWDGHEVRFGKDTYGFGFLPGGAYSSQHGFLNKGAYGYIWSSSQASDEYANARIMLHSHRGMSKSAYHKNTALSVRCLKDVDVPVYNLTLSVEPDNTGTAQGSGQYWQGQNVSVSAQPADGYVFVHWKDQGGSVLSELPVFNYTMPAENKSLVAVFKLEDLTISSFPWIESFESLSFPPRGWSIFNESGAARTWVAFSDFNFTENGSICAFHEFGNFSDGLQKGWLISPPISIPAGSNMLLTFWSYNVWPSWYDKNKVLVSTTSANPSDGGFNQIWMPVSVLSEWERTILSLQAYAGQSIYIAFYYEGRDAHSWHLDDVSIKVSE